MVISGGATDEVLNCGPVAWHSLTPKPWCLERRLIPSGIRSYMKNSPVQWKHIWLVLWLPSILFSHINWEFHHPNWRTHIFQRGGPTTKQIWCFLVVGNWPTFHWGARPTENWGVFRMNGAWVCKLRVIRMIGWREQMFNTGNSRRVLMVKNPHRCFREKVRFSPKNPSVLIVS